jgi:apolipoprotein N-acyltransferase
LAYTQFGDLPLMQLVSVTGIYGLTFLITWLAPVVNWLWEQEFGWPVVRRGAMIYAGVMTAVLILGGARLVFAAPDANEVKVAGVQSHLGKVLLEPDLAWFFEGDVSKADWNTIFTKTTLVIGDQFQKSKAAAQGGAKIVSWAEASVMVPKADESAFLDRGRHLAQQEQIYLVMAYAASLHTDPARVPQDKMYENKVVIVGPAGDVLSTYRKTILVPGMEALLSVAGDDDATVVATPYGRLSSLICYDNDFPSFVRAQVGQAGVDILIDPSGDWEDIDPYHTNMMAFRAIENGFSVVRITTSGLSAAYDYQGRTLATMDYFKTDDKVFTAYVPLRGVTTLYSRVGDLFAWMTIAGLISLIGRAILRGRRPAAVQEGRSDVVLSPLDRGVRSR